MIRLCCAASESFPTQPLSVLARASERLTPPCVHVHHAAVQVGSGWSASETPRNNLTSSMKKNKHSKRKKTIEIYIYRNHPLQKARLVLKMSKKHMDASHLCTTAWKKPCQVSPAFEIQPSKCNGEAYASWISSGHQVTPLGTSLYNCAQWVDTLHRHWNILNLIIKMNHIF